MDYKAGDCLPAIHPSTYEYNCLPRLILHYSGFFVDNNNSAHYFCHTEHWSESGNSICTTLHKLLTNLETLSPDLALTIDGHTTNRNKTFF